MSFLVLKLIVLLMSNRRLCSLSLPRGAVGWSVVCDCGIVSSYSRVFCSQSSCWGIMGSGGLIT